MCSRGLDAGKGLEARPDFGEGRPQCGWNQGPGGQAEMGPLSRGHRGQTYNPSPPPTPHTRRWGPGPALRHSHIHSHSLFHLPHSHTNGRDELGPGRKYPINVYPVTHGPSPESGVG